MCDFESQVGPLVLCEPWRVATLLGMVTSHFRGPHALAGLSPLEMEVGTPEVGGWQVLRRWGFRARD